MAGMDVVARAGRMGRVGMGGAVTSPAPAATDDQWRALIWAFVRFITEGGPEPFAALQAAKREMERAKG